LPRWDRKIPIQSASSEKAVVRGNASPWHQTHFFCHNFYRAGSCSSKTLWVRRNRDEPTGILGLETWTIERFTPHSFNVSIPVTPHECPFSCRWNPRLRKGIIIRTGKRENQPFHQISYHPKRWPKRLLPRNTIHPPMPCTGMVWEAAEVEAFPGRTS
jgi:hypothetical protein